MATAWFGGDWDMAVSGFGMPGAIWNAWCVTNTRPEGEPHKDCGRAVWSDNADALQRMMRRHDDMHHKRDMRAICAPIQTEGK